MEAWHFTDGLKLRDGQPLVVGQTYRYEGEIKMCARGYHASKQVIDALTYAPGAQLSRVVLGGKIITGDDKAVASERTVLWTLDTTAILRRFAAECAYGVLVRARAARREPDPRSWQAVAVAWKYRDDEGAEAQAARAAAWDAAWCARPHASAAWDGWCAARDAARDAAVDAAKCAAWAAARAAAWAGPSAAAGDRLDALVAAVREDS